MALVLTALFANGAAGQDPTTGADRPDAGPAPLILTPNGRSETGVPPGAAPPRSVDSVRAPVPDRLALPAWIQDAPLAPPTPWVQSANPAPSDIPPFDGTTGGGAKRLNAIVKRGSRPADLPPDSVTRTPEDQSTPPQNATPSE